METIVLKVFIILWLLGLVLFFHLDCFGFPRCPFIHLMDSQTFMDFGDLRSWVLTALTGDLLPYRNLRSDLSLEWIFKDEHGF